MTVSNDYVSCYKFTGLIWFVFEKTVWIYFALQAVETYRPVLLVDMEVLISNLSLMLRNFIENCHYFRMNFESELSIHPDFLKFKQRDRFPAFWL